MIDLLALSDFTFVCLGSNTLNVDLTLSANSDIFEWDGSGSIGSVDVPVTIDAGAGSGDILHYTITGLVETSPFTTETETPGLAYYFTGFEEYHLTLTSTGEIRDTLTLGASDDTFTWEITNGYTSLAGVFNAVAANGIATLDGKVDAGAGHDTLIIKGKGHTYIDRDRTFRSGFVNFEAWILGGESVSNPEGCYFSGTVSGIPPINYPTGTVSSFNSFADDCTILMLGFRSTLANHAKEEGESEQTIIADREIKIGQAPSEDSAGDSSLTVRHGATLILYSATDSVNNLAFSEQTLLRVKDFKLEGQLFTYYGTGNNFLTGSYLSLYDEGTFTWAPVSQPRFATNSHHTAIIVAGASNKIVGIGETALFDPPDGVTLNITTTRAETIDSKNDIAINLIRMGFSLYGFENFIKRGPGKLQLQVARSGLKFRQPFVLRELTVEEGMVSIHSQSGLIAPKIIFKDGVSVSGGLIGLAREIDFFETVSEEKTIDGQPVLTPNGQPILIDVDKQLEDDPTFYRPNERPYVYQYLKTLFDPTREDSNFDKILFEIGGAKLSYITFRIGKLHVGVGKFDEGFEGYERSFFQYKIVKDPSLDALILVNPGAGFTTSFTNISFDGFSEMEVSGAGDVEHAGESTVRDKVTFVAAEPGKPRGRYGFKNGTLITKDLTLAGGNLYVDEGYWGLIALHGVSSTFDWSAGDFIGIGLSADNRSPTDIDTFSITRSGGFGIDGSIISGFEIFILNNVGATLTQSGDFVVPGTTTLTAGTYIVAAGGTLNSQSLTLASDASLQIAPAIEDDPNTLEIVETTPAGKVELSGASTFTWAGGTLGGDNQQVIMIVADDLADEIDTFNLQHGTGEDISIIGSHFTGFEVFTKSGAAAIEQIGTFSVANKVTLSAGTYTIADEGILQTTDLTVSGSGSLKVAATNTDATKAGKVTLLGDSTFSWQSGVVNTVVDATNGDGVDHIDLVLTGSMAINAALFKGFDTLTVSGTGQGSQTGALNLTGLLIFSAGSYTYTLAAGAGLTGSDLTVVGGSLAALGTVAGEDIGKVTLLGDSTLLWQGGAISALIDATDGTGNDTLNLQPIANFDIDAALITGFEIFTLDGTASGTTTISQSNTLAIGNASSVGSMATFSRANTTYTIADEGVLEVYGSLTVTDGALAATGTGKVLLHGTSTLTWSGGSITAPVTADNNANEIDKFVLIYDGTLSTFDGSLFTGFEAFTNTDASTVSVTGAITQQGALTIGGTVTFAELAASTSFTYTIAAEGVLSAVNLSLAGGSLNAGTAAGKASGKIDLTGASTFTWTGGTIAAGLVITADDTAGEMDSMDLTNTAALSIAGESFVGFESFTKDGAGTVTQSGTFTIGGLATFSAGSYTIADGAMLQAVNLTIDGGGLAVESGMGKTGSGKVVLTGASTFKLSATGSYDVGLAIEADDVAMGVEVDSFVIEHNGGTLSLNGDIITGFEKFTASGSSVITQSGILAIAGDVTFSAGSYTIADGAMLQAVNLTIDGGGLAVESGTGKAGSGKVVLTGASTFTWSDGSYDVGLAIEADDDAMGEEIDSFEISHSGGTLDLDGAKITGFEEFTVSGNSAIAQSGTLVIAGDVTFSAGEYMVGTATISAGEYILGGNAELHAVNLTLSGTNNRLLGKSTTTGNKIILTGASTFTWSGSSIFGDWNDGVQSIPSGDGFIGVEAANEDGKIDTLKISRPGSFMFTGTQFIGFDNFEVVVTAVNALTPAVGQFGELKIAGKATISGAGSYLIDYYDVSGVAADHLIARDLTLDIAKLFGNNVILKGASTMIYHRGVLDENNRDTDNIAVTADNSDGLADKLFIRIKSSANGLTLYDGDLLDNFEILTIDKEDGATGKVRFAAKTRSCIKANNLACDEALVILESAFVHTDFVLDAVVDSAGDPIALLKVPQLELNGGSIGGGGQIDLTGTAGVFKWLRGELTGTVRINAVMADGILRLTPLDAAHVINLASVYFVGFESLEVGEVSGTPVTAGAINQVSTLTITNADFYAGTYTYTVKADTELKVTTLTLHTGSGTLAAEAGNPDASTPILAGKVSLRATGELIWMDGTISAMVVADADASDGALMLQPSQDITLNIDGSLFTGFRDLQLNGAGNVQLSNILTLTGTATFVQGIFNTMMSGSLQALHLTMSGGTLAGTVKLLGTSTLEWRAGDITGTVNADNAGSEIDTLKLVPASAGTTIAISGELFTGFEALEVGDGSGTISGSLEQSGTLAVGAANFDLGSYTYTIKADGVLRIVNNLILKGGTLTAEAGVVGTSVAGKVELIGAATFTWNAGAISAVVDASSSGGRGKFVYSRAGNTSFSGGLFSSFQDFDLESTGETTQTGTFDLSNDGVFNIKAEAGTYILTGTLTTDDVKLLADNSEFRVGDGGALTSERLIQLTNEGAKLTVSSGGTLNAVAITLSGMNTLFELDGTTTVTGAITLSGAASQFDLGGTLTAPSIVLSGVGARLNIGATLNTPVTTGSGDVSMQIIELTGDFLTSDGTVNMGGGDDLFIWSGSNDLSGTLAIDGGAGMDTLSLRPGDGVSLTVAGASVTGFEVVRFAGHADSTVMQTEHWDVASMGIGAVYLTSGSYSISSGKSLTTDSLIIDGATLSGAGTVKLTGDNAAGTLSSGSLAVAISGAKSFTWSGGSFASGGSVAGTSGTTDTLTIQLSSETTINLNTNIVQSGFDILKVVAVAGGRLSVDQKSSYILSGGVTIDGSAAGASAYYKISGSLTTSSIVMKGTSTLRVAGNVSGSKFDSATGSILPVTIGVADGDRGDQTLIFERDNLVNGGAATTFDLGEGIDELIYESSNPRIRSAYTFRNIETLTLASTGTNVYMESRLTLSGTLGADNTFTRLKFDGGVKTFSAEGLVLNAGAVIDAGSIEENKDTQLTISSNNMSLELGATLTLTIIMPDAAAFSSVLTIRISGDANTDWTNLAAATITITTADGTVRDSSISIQGVSGYSAARLIVIQTDLLVLPDVDVNGRLIITNSNIYTITSGSAAKDVTISAGVLTGSELTLTDNTDGSTLVWSGGSITAPVTAASDASVDDKILLSPAVDTEFTMGIPVDQLYKGFEDLEKEGAGTVNLDGILVVSEEATFRDGVYHINEGGELHVPKVTVLGDTTIEGEGTLYTGGGHNTFSVTNGKIDIDVDGGLGKDTLKIDTDDEKVTDLSGANFYGFEVLDINGKGVVQIGSSGYGDVVQHDSESTINVEDDLALSGDMFRFNGRLTGGVVSFLVSGFSNGSLKVYNGSNFSSSTDVRITDVLEIHKGGVLENTKVLIQRISADAGKIHSIKGEMTNVDLRFSSGSDTLYFSGTFDANSELRFYGGDDRLVWSAGTIAGSVDFGADINGDRVVLEFERGESVVRLFDATALDKVTYYEHLDWQLQALQAGDAKVTTSKTALSGDWYFCSAYGTDPVRCADIVNIPFATRRRATQLHLQAGVTYPIVGGSNINVINRGALVLPVGNTQFTNFTPPRATASDYTLGFYRDAEIWVTGVTSTANSATLTLANGILRLGTSTDTTPAIQIHLRGAGNYVTDATGGSYSFTLTLGFAELIADNNTFTAGQLSQDADLYKNRITRLFASGGIRAYEGVSAMYYAGTVTVTNSEGDVNVLKLTLTFNSGSGKTSSAGSSQVVTETPLPQREWGLWDTFSGLLGGDEEDLDEGYELSLTPMSHAALGEDLARYQMTALGEVLQQQHQQVDRLQAEGQFSLDNPNASPRLSGWVYSSQKQYERGDGGGADSTHEFNGSLMASGMLLAVTDSLWVGMWAGKSDVQREHDANHATGNQGIHSYTGGWSGVFAHYHGFGMSFSGLVSHSKGEVESRRFASVADSRLTGRGEFDLDQWHLQGSIGPRDTWQFGSVSVHSELQLRYLNVQQGAFNEQLLLKGAAGSYQVAASNSDLLQGGVSFTLSRLVANTSQDMTFGMLKQLHRNGNELAGSATDMSTLTATDTSPWEQLFYVKFSQSISVGNASGEFYYEGESDLNNYNNSTLGIRLQQTF